VAASAAATPSRGVATAAAADAERNERRLEGKPVMPAASSFSG
jgi:hypothetical protein